MKKLIAALSVFVCVSVLSFMIYSFVSAQTTPIDRALGRLMWDATKTDIEGNPTNIAFYVIAFSALDQDMNAGGTSVTMREYEVANCNCAVENAVESCWISLSDFQNLPNGEYKAWCKAVDSVGNQSVWSESLQIAVTSGTPNPPTNIRLIRGKIVIKDGVITIEFESQG